MCESVRGYNLNPSPTVGTLTCIQPVPLTPPPSQELERLRGPQPKWYELKNSQFHKEARKNNQLIAAKKHWNEMRDYTESVWRSRDLYRPRTARY